MATVNVDVHYTKDAGGVKGFDKDDTYGTSFNNIKYTSGWSSAFSSRAVTKVVFKVQVCLQGKHSGSITNKFTLSASYNGTSVTLGSKSFTRNCTGYSGNDEYPWTNFAIPSYNTDYLQFDVTNANTIDFLQSYGKNMTVKLVSGNYSFYNQVDVIIDSYTYSDPPTVTITYPKASKTTYNTKPRIKVTGSSSSGSITNYRYSFDDSTWTNTGKTGTSATF